MPKAKSIDRVKYTKDRAIIYVEPSVPVETIELHYNEEQGVLIGTSRPAKSAKEVAQDLYSEAFDRCPECGKSLIHEAGCIRCICGWSRC